MNDKLTPSDVESRSLELMGLVELQSLIEEELGEFESDHVVGRSFQPITSGLGLQSPVVKKKRTPAVEEPVAAQPPELPQTEDLEPESSSTPSLASVIGESAEAQMAQETIEVPEESDRDFELTQEPPRLPSPGSFRRLFAFVVDEIFVLTLWVGAVVLTSNLLSGFQTGFSKAVLNHFNDPLFIRLAVLEFVAIWLMYLSVCLGVLSQTFGQAVWGIKVAFGLEGEEAQWARKLMRIMWTLVFFAPIVPSVLLVIRRRGKNLLDLLSGTHLYV